jgi:phage terminase Nu1 subunit (DNA packaging protein)
MKHRGAKPSGSLLTRPELAGVFGVNVQTILKWRHAGMPIAVQGLQGHPSRYSLPAVVQWRIDTEVQRLRGTSGADGQPISPQHERALLDRAKREMEESKLAERKGQLIEPAEFLRRFTPRILAAKTSLIALAGQLVQMGLIPASKESEVRTLIEDALREIAVPSTINEEPA